MEMIQWNKVQFIPKEVKINVLIDDEYSKEIQILLAKDSIMKEHKAPFAIRIQVLSGKIWFEAKDQRLELNTLDMISLKANVPHSLGGLDDTIIRLSLNKLDKIQRINTVLKKN
ncbi:cupin domain-containing protein [Campylobacter hepaticus]|uniref:Cupin domain-containing protein n=1 Tax=Campylobacter hepaticus TaxID=1813019 RepID=A0A424Z2F7_9BACT|nr:cupin domain-containing protein [Campylobacter hepaticus]MDX2331100.1 cupin domain-containing protein [Campylobacter hepaticus]MDX2371715.1 cupin domain-containing protein [Campylobacter hepaticus]MDX2397080.1 cupin domain-containing protein [Campylobacter hepaticus]MDX5508873.1 cupin domain-containing protein [Campylobacter hepaticus]QOW64334.1 cupin domain-containing protein [Campylobacter hepaticus]